MRCLTILTENVGKYIRKAGKIMEDKKDEKEQLDIRIEKITYVLHDKNNYVPDPCKTCANHPDNGGSGICNCILPIMNQIT